MMSLMIFMGLKEDAVVIFSKMFGPQIAKQLDTFDNPKLYPKDFLEECTNFMQKLISKDAADRNLRPLYEKYVENRRGGKK